LHHLLWQRPIGALSIAPAEETRACASLPKFLSQCLLRPQKRCMSITIKLPLYRAIRTLQRLFATRSRRSRQLKLSSMQAKRQRSNSQVRQGVPAPFDGLSASVCSTTRGTERHRLAASRRIIQSLRCLEFKWRPCLGYNAEANSTNKNDGVKAVSRALSACASGCAFRCDARAACWWESMLRRAHLGPYSVSFAAVCRCVRF